MVYASPTQNLLSPIAEETINGERRNAAAAAAAGGWIWLAVYELR
jgi:hypothetical protein